jgi:hypothetical protein
LRVIIKREKRGDRYVDVEGFSVSASCPARISPLLCRTMSRPRSEPGGREPQSEGGPESWFSALTTYLAYGVLVLFGHIRDSLGKYTGCSRYAGKHKSSLHVRVVPPPFLLLRC